MFPWNIEPEKPIPVSPGSIVLTFKPDQFNSQYQTLLFSQPFLTTQSDWYIYIYIYIYACVLN